MLFESVALNDAAFLPCDATNDLLRSLCLQHKDRACFREIGKSEQGRPINAIILGKGSQRVTLMAGAHSDEPVGSQTLRILISELLANESQYSELLNTFQFAVIPHINPDGEARNWQWIAQWPALEPCLLHAFREPPGRDLEFGFPDMRTENSCVAAFLAENAPIALHMSLHGMGYSEGAMLLIEKDWIPHTDALRDSFTVAAKNAGLQLHDHNRRGEKGFIYIAPGFTTTPRSTEMKKFFKAAGDQKMVELFHQSSMEYVKSLGGNPLCLVTEMPLFLIKADPEEGNGMPAAYLRFREMKPVLMRRLMQGKDISEEIRPFKIRPLSLEKAIQLQLAALSGGLKCVRDRR